MEWLLMWGLLSNPEVVQTGFATDIGSDLRDVSGAVSNCTAIR